MRSKTLWVIAASAIAAGVFAGSASGQVLSWTPEQLTKYTAQWKGERFPDGRPKVPDALLEQVKGMSAEEVIGISRQRYSNQFVSGLQVLNPGKKLVGRAVTLQLMPNRPEVADVVNQDWRAKGGTGALNHQTVIDMLKPGDVFVVDAWGNLDIGGIIGDNLAYYIFKTTGQGFVIDGPIRDLEGIVPFGMAGYYRGAVPPAITGTMVSGINTPVRIGNTTVMPGDVVLGDREGVYFIPPHLVENVVTEAEVTHIHDEWTKKKFDEGKYKSSDIYSRPRDPKLLQEYEEYLKQKLGPARYEAYQKLQQQAPAGMGPGRGGAGMPGGRGGQGAPGAPQPGRQQ